MLIAIGILLVACAVNLGREGTAQVVDEKNLTGTNKVIEVKAK